jgi:hypothetical protein
LIAVYYVLLNRIVPVRLGWFFGPAAGFARDILFLKAFGTAFLPRLIDRPPDQTSLGAVTEPI